MSREQKDQTTRSQWATLDVAPDSRRGLGQSTIFSVVRSSAVGPLSPIIATAVVVLLLAATAYVAVLVRGSVRRGIQDSLQTVLTANVGALKLWLEDQTSRVSEFASDPSFQAFAFQTVQPLSPGPSGSQSSAESKVDAEIEIQSRWLLDHGYLGWAILDPFGRVLRSSLGEAVGAQVPIAETVQRELVAGNPAIILPFTPEFVVTDQGREGFSHAMMCAVAPLRQDLQYLGNVALFIDPSDRFTEILTVARMGDSGETYAFDRNAVLISKSRFEPELVSARLLKPGQSSLLNVHVRNPGRDLRRSSASGEDASRWPKTRMADAATRGGSGVDVIGYEDYRGVAVVGAWTWLPRYSFGVTTELDVDEAFVSLRILRNAFLTLVASVLLAAATLLAISWITRPRQTSRERVEELNRRLGQYELQQRIGQGGMGTVYLGAHGLLERKVAIKVLSNADANERSLARFQREVQLSASLTHPNTIEIYDFGRTEEGTFFYVMEFVDGISLEQLVDHYGRQPAERVIYLLMQICGSIAEAHEAGMVHRDIKPANVLLTSRSGIHDLVKVLDFGLAKQLDHESLQITRTDSLTGTPLYMSPEAIRDASSADRLSDVYSIGAVGYTLLCGQPPFDGPTSADVCASKLHGEAEWPEEKIGQPICRELQSVLMRCLRRDPQERQPSALHLAAELSACTVEAQWSQHDAALWWREIFDGPYLDDLQFDKKGDSRGGTKGDTAVNTSRAKQFA
ncbi:MAG: protein kinase [Planctomycetota bacterium]